LDRIADDAWHSLGLLRFRHTIVRLRRRQSIALIEVNFVLERRIRVGLP
jgi:hypothetical protein